MSEISSSTHAAGERTRDRWLVLALVSTAFLMVELDITIVNVALPSIKEDLGFSPSDLQWVVNAYLLLFGGFVLLTGRVADLVGRRRMFLAGVAVFGLGSALSAIAPTSAVLVVGRAVQGLGGAALAPTGLSLLTTTFTDARERTRALGVWTFLMTGSVAIGLALGGVLTGTLSWRWIFVINLPVTVVVLITAARLLPKVPGALRQQFDVTGAVLCTAGPALLVFALANIPTWGWGAVRTLAPLIAGVIIVGAFAVVEWRTAAPLVRLGIFRIRSVTVGDLSFLLTSSAMFGAYFFGTLYLQEVKGYEPLRAGIALMPLAVGILAGVTSAEPLIRRLGIRTIAILGLTVGVAGAALLTQLDADDAYRWPFLPGLSLLSLGIGLAVVTLTFLATSGVPEHEAGLASGLYTAVSYLGGALGLAVLSTIAAARTEEALAASPDAELAALTTGYRAAYVAVVIMLGAALLVIAAFLRRRHVQHDAEAAARRDQDEESKDAANQIGQAS